MRLSLRPSYGRSSRSLRGARAPVWKPPPSACFSRFARGNGLRRTGLGGARSSFHMASIAERAEKAARAAPHEKGRHARTPAEIPAPGWKEIAFRTWKESSKDNVSLVAAGVAFYGFLAMVPLLGATVLTYGLVASPETVLKNVQSLATTLPKDVATLIGNQLLNVVKTSGGKKGLGVLVALAVALWGARNAAGSIIIALNIAYEEEEKRGWIRVTLLSLAITLCAVLLGMVGAAVVGAMARLNGLLPSVGPLAV